ncbi:hypothetical protein [Streptomyces sp. NPDC102462]|uniref:hypothetical protein n=1 Tax=Streptomyces sp. NPDC102462 TaxID=3366178 RepID=UPI003809677C
MPQLRLRSNRAAGQPRISAVRPPTSPCRRLTPLPPRKTDARSALQQQLDAINIQSQMSVHFHDALSALSNTRAYLNRTPSAQTTPHVGTATPGRQAGHQPLTPTCH